MTTINLFLSEDWNLENPNPKKFAKGSTEQLEESDTMINLPLEDVTLLEEDGDYQLYQINTYDNLRTINLEVNGKDVDKLFRSIMQGLKEAEETIEGDVL